MRFKDAIMGLLGDVDYISITACSVPAQVFGASRNVGGFLTHMRMPPDDCMRGRHIGAVTSALWTGKIASAAERTLGALEQAGVDLSVYQPAVSVDIFFDGKPLGLILLFRLASRPPISIRSLRRIKNLIPFLRWSLSSMGLRHVYNHPHELVRSVLTQRIGTSLRLTATDRAILTLLLTGYSYKQAAGMMGVTLDTVKKHMKKVYSRADVGGLSELWTKYYPQRWDSANPLPTT